MIAISKGGPLVHLWDAASGNQFATFRIDGSPSVNEVLFSRDFMFLASSDDTIQRVRLDPQPLPLVRLGDTLVDSNSAVARARQLLDARQWNAAATLYGRYPDAAPPIERASALIAAGHPEEAALLRDDLLKAGVLPGTLAGWIDP